MATTYTTYTTRDGETYPVLADCPNCDGTGYDEGFSSPCWCHLWINRRTIDAFARAAEPARPTRRSGRPGSGSGSGSGPTDRQVAFAASLLERAETVGGDTATTVGELYSRLTTAPNPRAASPLIDRMLAALASVPQPVASTRANRYAGSCRRCGGHVPAETGSLVKVDGRWAVEHAECPSTPPSTPTLSATLPDVPEGHYAIFSDGSDDLAFYRVDHGTGRWAGRVFVKRVIGGRPDVNVPAGQTAGILARIAADPDAGARYGREIGRCWRCNRHLTDAESRAAGIGPDCARRA